MTATSCPPNIAAWIAVDPERRIWRADGLAIWNFHPELGVQVPAAGLENMTTDQFHQIMCDALTNAARVEISHLEGQARDYQRMAAEKIAIRDTIKR